MPDSDSTEDFLSRFQRRAFETASEQSRDLGEDDLDLLELAGEESVTPDDLQRTLGGYMDVHSRAAAFTGCDGEPYTVAVEVEEPDPDAPTDAAEPYAGFLVFVRWASTGAGIMGHLESPDLAHAASPEEARTAVLGLSLYEVKAELDAAIRRREREREGDVPSS